MWATRAGGKNAERRIRRDKGAEVEGTDRKGRIGRDESDGRKTYIHLFGKKFESTSTSNGSLISVPCRQRRTSVGITGSQLSPPSRRHESDLTWLMAIVRAYAS